MPASLTAPNPATVNLDAHRTGAHHAHAARLVAAVRAIAPDVHVRIGDLAWSVRLSVDPMDRHALGDVTVTVPAPWDVRGGVCVARATEWTVARSRPLGSPGQYTADVHDAARRAVAMLDRIARARTVTWHVVLDDGSAIECQRLDRGDDAPVGVWAADGLMRSTVTRHVAVGGRAWSASPCACTDLLPEPIPAAVRR